MLNKQEEKQYSRHLILDEIGESGQLKLKKAKVLVIGAGGLSCPVLQYLAAAGVGTIGIIDDDVVEQSNLQRQIVFTHQDIGKNKAETAAKRLAQLNPYITFNTYNKRLDKLNAITLFEQYDIIVDGTDNFPTRYLVNDAVVLTNKPLVFGSIFKFEGQVSVLNYNNGPTYRCLYPTPPIPGEVPNCSDIGVLGVLPGIIGSLQANEVIKIICGLGNILNGKLLTFDALSLRQMVLEFDKNETLQINALADNYEFFCGIKPIGTEITLVELQKNIDSYHLLDVRSDLEREHYNIGGIHIPLSQLENRIKELPTDKSIVVYCKSGIRSKTAIEILKDLGIQNNLVNLKDGLS